MRIISRDEYQRQAHIGGSDAAAVLGLSPWRSPLDVWLEKTGKGPKQEETEAMRWGSLMEPVVADRYAAKTGLAVWNTSKVFLSDDGLLAASIDRLVTPGKDVAPMSKNGLRTQHLLEVKTSRMNTEWGEPGTDEIPLWYQTQVQQYLGLTGAKLCDVAVLFGGAEFAIYPVHADPETWGRLEDALKKWWHDHIVEGEAPDPRSAAEVEKLFPKSVERTVVASEGLESAIVDLSVRKAEAKALEGIIEALKDRICAEMKDAEALVRPDGTKLVTWKTTKGKQKVDWRAFAAEVNNPLILNKYISYGEGYRQFLLKLKEEA